MKDAPPAGKISPIVTGALKTTAAVTGTEGSATTLGPNCEHARTSGRLVLDIPRGELRYEEACDECRAFVRALGSEPYQLPVSASPWARLVASLGFPPEELAA